MIALLIFGVADLSGSGGIVNSSIAAWVDLTAPEPERGTGHASTPATRAMRRSGPSALPSPSRSASTASAVFSPPAENGPLGSLRAGRAPEVLVFGSDSSVLAPAEVPQPPGNLVTLPVIDGLAQDRQAPTVASSLATTPNTLPSGDAEPAEMRPAPVSVSVAEPQISATAEASSVHGPPDERVPLDGEFGPAGTTGSASPARARTTFDRPHARTTQGGVETGTGKISSSPIGYALPVPYNGIALSNPPDGLVITPDDPPVVMVEGTVDDSRTTTLWIVANDQRIPVRVSEGRFRTIVPMVEPTLRVWAEASLAGEPGSRSQVVTVHTTGARKPSAILVMEWPRESQDLDVQVSAFWRAHPDNLDDAAQPVRLTAVSQPSSTGPSDVFWLRNARPGAYSMVLRYRGVPPNGDVHPTLYVPDGDGLAMRAIRPVRLGSSGRAVLARMLLPQGVLWEQEGWFSGSSESVDTVTKFRFPDGINWVERKADLQ
jgi:hypothetical protein